MSGTVYTFLSGNSGQNDAAIRTAQGTVSLGQSGVFQPNEYQAVVSRGFTLVAGPAFSPSLSLTAPTVAAGTTGLPNGVYKCAVTFVTAAGETRIGPEVTITVTSKQILWSSIPLGNVVEGVLERKLYRTAAGGASGTEKLVTTLSDNTTTTFTDNVADGSLGAAAPTSDTAGVIGPMNPQPQETLVALLTGNPGDDTFAIGAGTGIKIASEGGGGGGGTVESVVAADDTITVDDTDPANPAISVATATVLGLPVGLTGATANTRFAGATASGAPSTGTFATGDWIIDLSVPTVRICTAGGSPGTWGTLPQPAAGTASPIIDGTAAAGSSASYSRQDHVHPTDTSRAPLTPRVQSITANTATPAMNVGANDEIDISGQSTAITSMTSGLVGTPVNGQNLIVRIAATAAVAIAWGASFISDGVVALPTITVASKTITVGLRYNSTAGKFVCLAASTVGY